MFISYLLASISRTGLSLLAPAATLLLLASQCFLPAVNQVNRYCLETSQGFCCLVRFNRSFSIDARAPNLIWRTVEMCTMLSSSFIIVQGVNLTYSKLEIQVIHSQTLDM